ncbi:MAG: hypothetical protein ACRD29_15695 [Acidimicrobiales bacterium]
MNPPIELGGHSVIDRVFRDEWTRVVAVLARSFRDLDLAADSAQQAFAEAAARWPKTGTPASPVFRTCRRVGLIEEIRFVVQESRRGSRKSSCGEKTAGSGACGGAAGQGVGFVAGDRPVL